MKNIYTLILCAVALLGCDDNDNFRSVNEIDLKSGEKYVYHTGFSGDEQGAVIREQPQNFKISEIVRDASTSWEITYQYEPAEGFVGEDRAVVEIREIKPDGKMETLAVTELIFLIP